MPPGAVQALLAQERMTVDAVLPFLLGALFDPNAGFRHARARTWLAGAPQTARIMLLRATHMLDRASFALLLGCRRGCLAGGDPGVLMP